MKAKKVISKTAYIILAATLASVALTQSALAIANVTFRVSVKSGGTEVIGDSENASVSENGRYIAFASNAEDLVTDDSNGVSDIFVRDTVNGTTTRVSLASDESQANGPSSDPSISSDGRYIAFVSEADNLFAGDDATKDVFVRDTQTGTTICLSTCASNPGGLISASPSMAGNGRYVAFSSLLPLAASDINTTNDIYRYDLQTSTIQRVTVGPGGINTSGGSEPSISTDGNYVVFFSASSALVLGDANSNVDVFIRNMSTNTTALVSVNTNEEQSNGPSYSPAISGDGRYVVFMSHATNLTGNDNNMARDIFVRDTVNGTTTRVSVDASGVEGNNISELPAISKDGKYIAFVSEADNLVPNDLNTSPDVFVKNLDANVTIRVSVHTNGTEANGTSFNPAISQDGRFIAFQSSAFNLVDDDFNAKTDVYARQIFTFEDVPPSYWSALWIERLYNAGITGGCTQTPLNYCPDNTVTRAQMSVFLEKGINGISFNPSDVIPTFTDTVGHWAEDWIEALKNDGITSGCGTGIYCPENSVTRAQMAVFLLKSIHGASYVPPEVGVNTGFNDVPTSYWAAAWIKQLAAESITGGCGNNNYCPENEVTRAQMAVFLVKAFSLP